MSHMVLMQTVSAMCNSTRTFVVRSPSKKSHLLRVSVGMRIVREALFDVVIHFYMYFNLYLHNGMIPHFFKKKHNYSVWAKNLVTSLDRSASTYLEIIRYSVFSLTGLSAVCDCGIS